MDQVFEGEPKADIQLQGRKVSRSEVRYDWGSKLRWRITRDGEEVAAPVARMETAYEHADETPGVYEVTLQIFKYVNYKKNKEGAFTESKFVDISNKVTYTIPQ